MSDGFKVGQRVTLSGSTAGNDGSYVIEAISTDGLRLTLDKPLDAEVAASGMRVTSGAVVRLSENASFVVDPQVAETTAVTFKHTTFKSTASNTVSFLRSDAAHDDLPTITRVSGNWADDGFKPDLLIQVIGDTLNKTGSSQVFRVDRVEGSVLVLKSGDVLTNEANVANITVVGPDTITRADGLSWALEGFRAGMILKVAGSAKNTTNDHAYRIEAVHDNVLVMDDLVTLTDEANVNATLEGVYKVSVLARADAARPLITDTSNNTNVSDLALDVNSALEDAGLGQMMQATADGARLVLTASAGVTGKPQFVFKDNAGSFDERDTITRDSGSWLDDGFREGATITVTGTKRFFGLGENNDGTFRVDSISEDGKRLTLALGDHLVNSQGRILSAFDDVSIRQTFAFSVTPDAIAATELGLGAAGAAKDADQADLLIEPATGGEAYRITLDGAKTLGDVLARIKQQTNGAIRAEINADKDGIDLIQVATLTGDPQLTFKQDGTLARSAGNWGVPVERTVLETLVFADSGQQDTITWDGGNWNDAGFRAGQSITVSTSAHNNGRYQITAISPTARS